MDAGFSADAAACTTSNAPAATLALAEASSTSAAASSRSLPHRDVRRLQRKLLLLPRRQGSVLSLECARQQLPPILPRLTIVGVSAATVAARIAASAAVATAVPRSTARRAPEASLPSRAPAAATVSSAATARLCRVPRGATRRLDLHELPLRNPRGRRLRVDSALGLSGATARHHGVVSGRGRQPLDVLLLLDDAAPTIAAVAR